MNQKVSFIQNYFQQKVAMLSEPYFHESLRNQWGIEFGRESGGPAGAREPVLNKQLTIKNPLSTSRFLQVSDSFHLKTSFKLSLAQFQAGNKVHVYLIQYSVFCSSALFCNAGSKVQFIL